MLTAIFPARKEMAPGLGRPPARSEGTKSPAGCGPRSPPSAITSAPVQQDPAGSQADLEASVDSHPATVGPPIAFLEKSLQPDLAGTPTQTSARQLQRSYRR